MENPFHEELPIFEGRIILVTEDNEYGMSNWVKGFGLKDALTDKWVLELNLDLSLENWEIVEEKFHARFRIFPIGGKFYDVVIDPFGKTYVYLGETKSLDSFASTFKQ